MKIQIIIPTINLWNKYTKPAIDSVVRACEGLDYRILLIDNASTDETLVEAGKLVSDRFAHKRNETRWGCSQSWNYGIKDAFERGYDHVFVINNDVLIHPKAIWHLLYRFDKQEEGIPLVEDNIVMMTTMNIAGECITPEGIFDKDSLEKALVPETEHPDFSGFMINKKCWDEVGEFDEGFNPAYYEDNDYHRRINQAGLKAITVPQALFYHYGSKTNLEADVKPVVTHEAFRKNQGYYIAKWGGTPGGENYEFPFNSETNSLKWTKQQNG